MGFNPNDLTVGESCAVIKSKHRELMEKHKEVIGFISTQRLKYMAHADDVKWADFPNVRDKEYEELIADIKDLLKDIGSVAGSQMLPTNSNRPEIQTSALFDDLLRIHTPGLDVATLSKQYDRDVERLMEDDA